MTKFILLLSVLFCTCNFAQTTQPATNDQLTQVKGYVENFFKHNYHDITARKTIDWGDASADEQGNLSIRYQYEVIIWDKEKILENKVFTFDKDGNFVKVESLPGFPQKLGSLAPATQPAMGEQQVEAWLKARVEEYFATNYKDITKRSNPSWGKPMIDADGNLSIRYKCNATIWGKDQKPFEQSFTFTPKGEFVRTEKVVTRPSG